MNRLSRGDEERLCLALDGFAGLSCQGKELRCLERDLNMILKRLKTHGKARRHTVRHALRWLPAMVRTAGSAIRRSDHRLNAAVR